VAAGEITPTSALLWTHAGDAGPVVVEIGHSDAGVSCAGGSRSLEAVADAANDNAVFARAARLRPSTRYVYRFCQGAAASAIGAFRTAPRAAARVPLSFAVSGDADGTIDPATGQPAYNRFEVYGRMTDERNAFNVNLGDVMYSDSAVAGVPPALTLQDKWAKYRLNLTYPNLLALRAATGLYSHWDDHEFIDDFSVGQYGRDLYNAGAEAFFDYNPVSYRPDVGLYRHFRWGRNLEIFLPDERSFRDPPASASSACRDPQTGRPDPFPLLPLRLRRSRFGITFDSPAQCRAIIRDPARTMLGDAQLTAFERDLARSRATFKVILNEIPIMRIYVLPYDRWEGYEAEREQLLDFIRRAHVRNVVWITTDLHATMINDVLTTTFREEGGSRDTGMDEVITGPVALKTFARDAGMKLGFPNAGELIRRFFKAPRPVGLGMRCAALDAYSYVEVRVTSRTLTIYPKDDQGRPLRERPGAPPCRPVVIPARR
jgi:phosphodiesterase/alkaline phosphatase D-like protein